MQEKLGNEVHQAGSRVDENTFRFDFSYRGRLSDELMISIEEEVNQKVQKGTKTKIEFMPLEDAKNKGAMALFEDKYDDVFRGTVDCGVLWHSGTHGGCTGFKPDIGDFRREKCATGIRFAKSVI